MSSKCVQGTNDSSIVSKASAAERGYIHDPFLAGVVRKKARRAPLINRGYYIRMKAVDDALRRFIRVTASSEGTRYIISLGAGFDTAFFRLKSQLGLLTGVVFIEVDFYDVALNKAKLIQQSELLATTIGSFEVQPDSNILLRSPGYYVIASDLTHEAVLDACLRELIPDWEAPVFCLSECVLTYVTPKHTAALIDWIRQGFPCCLFFLYEQIKPYDSFGIIMCQHFKSLGSPLRCIEASSQLGDQKRRFSQGWQLTEAHDMAEYYLSLEPRERDRVEGLEVFDEQEEWWSKCAHYFVLAAQSAGFYHRHQRRSFFDIDSEDGAAPDSGSVGSWPVDSGLDVCPMTSMARVRALPLLSTAPSSAEASGDSQAFRLHWAALWAPSDTGLLLRIGGYGRDPLAGPGHRKVSSLTLLNPWQHRAHHLLPAGSSAQQQQQGWFEQSLGPAIFPVSGKPRELLVFGGKASPLKASNLLLKLTLQPPSADDAHSSGDFTAAVSEVAQRGSRPDSAQPPSPRWRHAGCSCAGFIVLYGGRTPDCLCLADAYTGSLDSDGVHWEALPATPGPRCSAAMTAHPSGRPVCFLSGGLTLLKPGQQPPHLRRLLHPAWDLWQLDLPARQWSRLRLEPRLSGPPGLSVPRFGHSMHGLGTGDGTDGDCCWLVCFGGVPVSAKCPDLPDLTVVRLRRRGGSVDYVAEFVNLGVDYRDSGAPAAAFLAFNAAAALVSPPATVGEAVDDDGTAAVWAPLLAVVGGGGSCFSFGTHLNGQPVCLPVPDLLLPVAALFD